MDQTGTFELINHPLKGPLLLGKGEKKARWKPKYGGATPMFPGQLWLERNGHLVFLDRGNQQFKICGGQSRDGAIPVLELLKGPILRVAFLADSPRKPCIIYPGPFHL